MAKCCSSEFSASKFNDQVDIETLSLTPNDSGDQSESWSTFISGMWCSITPKQKWEQNFAQRLEPRIIHEIRARWQSGITTTMRVKFGSRYFQIKAAINVEENDEFLLMTCEEGTGT